MYANLISFARSILGTLRDLTPIILVIVFFQVFVLDEPFPQLAEILLGLFFVMIGLALFIRGLELGLFPLGEGMADAFARQGVLFWLLAFAFSLGFGTTVAEPALIAVAAAAAESASDAGVIPDQDVARTHYALGLRYTVAVAVGTALIAGVIRILKGWPLHYFIIVGYGLVICLTPFAPGEIVGVAYDSGGVTTSTVTVPLVTALGVGLAAAIRGRNPLIDGFGLIAMASLTPIIFVLIYGMVA